MFRLHGIRKSDVEKEIDDGYVRIAFHPQHKNLAILNYTEKTQFERHWNATTMRCRALVVEWKKKWPYLPIVIGAPRKFFNNGEPEAPNLSEWKFKDIYMSEKLDGYYIAVRNDSKYGLIVTSRGSFDNKYIDAAKKLLPWEIPPDVDYFCELCQDFEGDENIIVARHPKPRLVCWGYNDYVPLPNAPGGWSGEIAKEITEKQFRQYMTDHVEGLVAYNLNTKERVKVKTQWYLALHRAISRCTKKDVFEIVSGGGRIAYTDRTTYIGKDGEEYTLEIAALPEEHIVQMEDWEEEFRDEYDKVMFWAKEDTKKWEVLGKKAYALTSETPKDIKSVAFALMGNKSHDAIKKLTWGVVKNHLLRDSTN